MTNVIPYHSLKSGCRSSFFQPVEDVGHESLESHVRYKFSGLEVFVGGVSSSLPPSCTLGTYRARETHHSLRKRERRKKGRWTDLVISPSDEFGLIPLVSPEGGDAIRSRN